MQPFIHSKRPVHIEFRGIVLNIAQDFTFLSKRIAIADKIKHIRQQLNLKYQVIDRISVVIYHEERNTLQTYVLDEDHDSQFSNYEVSFSKCQSLFQIAQNKTARIVNDMSVFSNNKKAHTQQVEMAGYLSSFTMPLFYDNKLLGFFFVNSHKKNALCDELTESLGYIAVMVSLVLQQDLSDINILKSTIESMKLISQYRDPETGEHLKRMAYYSLLIARKIATKYQLSDEFIEHLFLYAPLHDLGKLMIPDAILLKSSKLSVDEFKHMKLHTTKGSELVEKLVNIYQLHNMPFIEVLKNIVCYHHEQIDGGGYPHGLTGKEIPIEAKIVAVADIFDALTSNRPYKKAWSNNQAFEELYRMSANKIEFEFVHALDHSRGDIEEIQQLFQDEIHDWTQA